MISYWGVEHGEVSKAKKKKDYSGAAVGGGSVVTGAGLLGGGVPGARPDSGRLAHVKYGTKYDATKHIVSATRGGIFGYRADAHQSFLNRQNADEKAHGGKKTTRVNHYLRGQGTGKIGPEKQVINHMKAGRAGSNAALFGGAALVAAGLHERKKRQGVAKRKRDDYKADAVFAGGATTAGLAGGGSLVMDQQGRKWANRSADTIRQAQKMNPKTGGVEMRTTKTRVPDPTPAKSGGTIASEHKAIFAGRSSKHAEQVGRLRGTATQQRYFAKVYGKTAKMSRKVGLAGAGVAAAGLAAKHYEIKRKPVQKNLAMPKGVRIPSTGAFTDLKGSVVFRSNLPKQFPGDSQRVLHTTHRPKRKLQRRSNAAVFQRNV